MALRVKDGTKGILLHLLRHAEIWERKLVFLWPLNGIWALWMDGKLVFCWPLNGIWALKWNLGTLNGWKVGVLLAPKWNMGTLDGWKKSWCFVGP